VATAHCLCASVKASTSEEEEEEEEEDDEGDEAGIALAALCLSHLPDIYSLSVVLCTSHRHPRCGVMSRIN